MIVAGVCDNEDTDSAVSCNVSGIQKCPYFSISTMKREIVEYDFMPAKQSIPKFAYETEAKLSKGNMEYS